MTEQTAKKIKIYKLATELNLSSDTIIEFLKKKGFEVKSHMSVATDDMMKAITAHFKKEKDVAERHQRKVQEFRTSRKKETPEKVEKKAVVEEEPVAKQAEPEPVEEAVEVEASQAQEVEAKQSAAVETEAPSPVRE